MSKQGKILVAMSGGIDSTVAAVMLHNEGYEVVGITMKTWDYASSGGSKKETGCCNLDSINDARQLAVDLGFAHYIVDIREEFGDAVIENFVEEYIAGRTPNPCVLCNTHIKWTALLKRAKQMDCEFIATGHYAQLREENERYVISKGVDDWKDQSYVLWGLAQENLAMSRFPLGGFHKKDIRKMCMEWGYTDLAKKSESYEICFIPDNDYRGFLKRRVPDLEAKVNGGKFVNSKGEVVGTHEGYPFFTIGQRKGLGIAFGKPMFVTDIIAETNTVVLGEEEDLQRTGMIVGGINLQKYATIIDGLEATAKVRYKDAGTSCRLYNDGKKIRAEFEGEVKGVAPGQSAVFYEGNDVIGGGIIHSSFTV
ncbi:MAG: tRNA 2-thiouridine(34) synthase MnmA [Chitinophagaceae bacterium]|nr:tRNA 2-thiouridine(34) synthase MnmA [Chitinophagaceae bacterium]